MKEVKDGEFTYEVGGPLLDPSHNLAEGSDSFNTFSTKTDDSTEPRVPAFQALQGRVYFLVPFQNIYRFLVSAWANIKEPITYGERHL